MMVSCVQWLFLIVVVLYLCPADRYCRIFNDSRQI